jgi:hypothetical protein
LAWAAVCGIVWDIGGGRISRFQIPSHTLEILMAPQPERARIRARVSRGPAVLAALINGVALEEIAKTENFTLKRVEKLLRDELRKRWIAPAQEYARLQIARLEAIASPLKDKARSGDLPTIDRLLKVMDRLDRYHGFTKLAALSSPSRDDVRAKLGAKFNSATRNAGGGA